VDAGRSRRRNARIPLRADHRLTLPPAKLGGGAFSFDLLPPSTLASVDAKAFRNRLVLATAMWREATEEPLPRMPKGNPEYQLEAFELRLVDLLCSQATPETARTVADKTWDLVHDRPDDDRVKRRVVECHEALARLSARRGID
jgi:hypothetical protein